mgnify:CR=1 FL=1
MIVRKPFAFLIKHFKAIHLFLFGLLVYVCYKYNGIVSFLRNYISTGNGRYDAVNYINYTPIYIILGAIVVMAIIYYLMKYKDKPKKLYLFSIIGYIAVIILFIFLFNYLRTFSSSIIEQKTLRLYRDISLMGLIFQYIIIVIMLIRGLGFDIKKFNFSKDIQELNIDLTDNEEVELVMGFDTNKTKFKIRRFFREFRYFIRENILFTGLSLIVIVIILWIIVANYTSKNKVYKENEYFGVDFNMLVNGSYLTKEDNSLKKLSVGSSSLLVVKFKISSNHSDVLNPDNFILSIYGKTYSPNNKYCSSLKDIGKCYNKIKLTEQKKEYIFVYLVDDNVLNKKIYLKYDYGYLTNKNNSIIKVRLTPDNIDDEETTTKRINDTLEFNNSIIGDYKLKIEEYNISDNYEINADITLMPTSNNTIIRLKVSEGNDLIDNYALLKYTISGLEYTSTMKKLYNDNDYSYYEVNNITYADSIKLVLNSRHNNYEYILK